MSNRKRFIINGIILSLVGLLVRSVTLALNSFITKSIGAEGTGLFTLIMMVYSFAVTFATSGISLTVTRLVSEAVGEGKEGRIEGLLKSSIIYTLIFSGAATLTLGIGAPYFAYHVLSDGRCVLPLRILALSLIPLALSSVLSGYFIGVKRVAKNATVQVLTQICKVVITVLLLLKYRMVGSESAVGALCVSITVTEHLVFLFSLLQYLFDRRRIKGEKKGKNFASVIEMAVPLAVSAYIRSALLTLEHILIPKRLRDGGKSHGEALASYGVLHGMALPLLLYPMSPLSSFSSLLVPEFSECLARGEARRMERIASEAVNKTLTYSVAATVLVALFSEGLGYVIYDSFEAGRYIFLMSPIIPIMYLDHVTDSILKGIGEHVYSMWTNISDSILSVVLVWFLISPLGIGGYALVIVIMEGYNFILSAARLYSRIKFKISYFTSIILPALSAVISALVSKAVFLPITAFSGGVWLVLEILFAVSLFIAVYKSAKLLMRLK